MFVKYKLYNTWKLFDFKDTKESLAKELESRQVSDQKRKKFEVENEALKREVESLESSIQKVLIQNICILEVRNIKSKYSVINKNFQIC